MMGISGVPLSRVSSFRWSFHFLLPSMNLILKTPQKPTCQTVRTFNILNANYIENHSSLSIPTSVPRSNANASHRWKPMCLYYTQGKCTKMDDPIHLERFNHDCSGDFPLNAAALDRKRPQDFDFFLVFDLEGKVEILEFPVLMIDAKTVSVVDLFHRFVKPSAMREQTINEYIANKYGKMGLDRVWHDTAIPFNEVVQQFEDWLTQHHLWERKHDGLLNQAAFVTCGNWDVKTCVPKQCKVSKMQLPPYFMEWINLKDVYQNFYNPTKAAKGLRTMMEQLKIPMLGSHHLGIDDTKNIARVLLRMLADGAVIPITARRNPDYSGIVNFLYKNRIV